MPVCQSGLAREWVSHLFHGPINNRAIKLNRNSQSSDLTLENVSKRPVVAVAASRMGGISIY
jgi:hypothetical protein